MTREHQLIEAFVETADTQAGGFEVTGFLRTVAERCVRLLDVDAAGLMLADRHNKQRSNASTSENVRLLQQFAVETGEGPSLEAYRHGKPVFCTDLTADGQRWPGFAEASGLTGFASVHCLPLRLRTTVIGTLNLLNARPGTLSDTDARTGQALADIATIGLLNQRSLRRSEQLAGQLQRALTSRVAIEQAKGVIAERLEVDLETAFALLRAHARNGNVRISDLARDVVERSADVEETLHAPEPDLAADEQGADT